MEKAVLDRRLAQMEAEGVTFVCSTAIGLADAGATGLDTIEPGEKRGLGTASAPDVTVRSADEIRSTSTPWSWRRRHPCRATSGSRARPRRHPPGPRISQALEPGPRRRVAASPIIGRGAKMWSSSVAATPELTASAPRTAKGRPRYTSSRSCPSPERPPGREPLARVAPHPSHFVGPRRRRPTALCGHHHRIRRRRSGNVRAPRP